MVEQAAAKFRDVGYIITKKGPDGTMSVNRRQVRVHHPLHEEDEANGLFTKDRHIEIEVEGPSAQKLESSEIPQGIPLFEAPHPNGRTHASTTTEARRESTA